MFSIRVSDWDSQPIEFGDQIRYVCRRGYFFESDPSQLDVKYTCQVGGSKFNVYVSRLKKKGDPSGGDIAELCNL